MPRVTFFINTNSIAACAYVLASILNLLNWVEQIFQHGNHGRMQ